MKNLKMCNDYQEKRAEELERKLKDKSAEYEKKISELQEQIVKQSELIRGYDDEILELKAQCQELTQIERLSYKRLNGDKSAIPTEPIKIADYLIDLFMADIDIIDSPFLFDDTRKLQIDSLRQIAEHLLVFCGRKEDGRI